MVMCTVSSLSTRLAASAVHSWQLSTGAFESVRRNSVTVASLGSAMVSASTLSCSVYFPDGTWVRSTNGLAESKLPVATVFFSSPVVISL